MKACKINCAELLEQFLLLNNRPRKKFKYKTTVEVMENMKINFLSSFA